MKTFEITSMKKKQREVDVVTALRGRDFFPLNFEMDSPSLASQILQSRELVLPLASCLLF
jgi:hypothetical protein